MTDKWRWIGIIVIAIFILGVGGKLIVDKKLDTTRKSLEKDYQQGIELIQTYVTDYLVNNYEGIEKIEWQGIGVEWRNSPTHGESMFGNYVNSYVQIFVTQDDFVRIGYRLTDETEYDDNLKKYVLRDVLNHKNIDSTVKLELENTTRQLNEEEKKVYSKLKKSNDGSKHAEFSYNLRIHELTY